MPSTAMSGQSQPCAAASPSMLSPIRSAPSRQSVQVDVETQAGEIGFGFGFVAGLIPSPEPHIELVVYWQPDALHCVWFIFQVEGQHFRITVRGQVIHGHAVAWLDNPMGPVQNVNPVVDQDRFGIAAVIPQGGYTRSVADIVIIYDHMQANRARIVEDIRQKIAKGRVAVCHRIGLPVLVGDGKTDGVEPVKFYLVQDVRVGHRPQATGLSLPRLGAVPAYAGDRPHLPEPVHDLISAGMPCLSARRHRAEDHETRKSENCAPVERSIVRFYVGHVLTPLYMDCLYFRPLSRKTRSSLAFRERSRNYEKRFCACAPQEFNGWYRSLI